VTVHRIPKRHIFVPYNGKIADITHADTNQHNLDLAAALSETRNIISVLIQAERVSGTGYFRMYPNAGAQQISGGTGTLDLKECVLAVGSNNLLYQLSVANDDWDIWCMGYVVEDT